MKEPLTQDALRRELLYVPEVGQFIRLRSGTGVKFGQVAGSPTKLGYIEISVNGTRYRAHRLAFFWMNGTWPKEDVDHINGWRTDNRWSNLREATRQQNSINSKLNVTNTSGARGVLWNKEAKKWRAQIYVNNRLRFLGYFKNKEDAITSYNKTVRELYGPFCPSVERSAR